MTGRKLKDSIMEVTIPSKPEFLRVVRLMVSGYASRWPIPIDEVENIKVAVSEACNTAMQNAAGAGSDESIRIRCWHEDDVLVFEIIEKHSGASGAPDAEYTPEERGLGMLLIRTIMDEVNVESKPEQGTTITMKKKIAVA